MSTDNHLNWASIFKAIAGTVGAAGVIAVVALLIKMNSIPGEISNLSNLVTFRLNTLESRIGELKESTSEQIKELKDATADRYTRSDARRDLRVRDEYMQENRGSIKELQNRYSGGTFPR